MFADTLSIMEKEADEQVEKEGQGELPGIEEGQNNSEWKIIPITD